MARKDFTSPKWSSVIPQLKLRWSPHSIDLFQRDMFSWWWTDIAECEDFTPTVSTIYGNLWGNFRQRIMWLRARFPEAERERLEDYCIRRAVREISFSKIKFANQPEADKSYRSPEKLLRNISEWFSPKNDEKCWNSPWKLVPLRSTAVLITVSSSVSTKSPCEIKSPSTVPMIC